MERFVLLAGVFAWTGALKLVSQGFEKGNMTTEMSDRPAVNWQEVPLDAAGRPLPKTRRGVRSKKDVEP